jgi:hypothetical protein
MSAINIDNILILHEFLQIYQRKRASFKVSSVQTRTIKLRL